MESQDAPSPLIDAADALQDQRHHLGLPARSRLLEDVREVRTRRRQRDLQRPAAVYPGAIPGVASAFKIKQHDGFRTMGDVQWRREENHRTVTLAG